MSSTLTAAPRHRPHLPSRLGTLALATALVLAAVIAVVMLVVAVRGDDVDESPQPVVELVARSGGQDSCQPSRVPVAC